MLDTITPYRFSRFCKIFQKGKIFALYHAILLQTVYLEDRVFECLRDLNNGVTPEILFGMGEKDEIQKALGLLEKFQLIVSVFTREEEILEKIQKKLLGKPNIEMMYLLITDDCNLRCGYCFLENNTPINFYPKKMNVDIAHKAIDLFLANIQNSNWTTGEKMIHIYGGEPLLNWQVFKEIVNYVDSLKERNESASRIKFVTVTNGTLVTREIADFFKDHNISVGVSIDGLELAHNKYRKNTLGEGSFKKAVKGYRTLIDFGVETGISCTLVPENLVDFPKTLEFLVNNIGIYYGISFNILHKNLRIPLSSEYLLSASQSIIEAFDFFRKKGIYEERMMRKVTSFIEKSLMPYDCSGCGQQLAISPDGKVGTCHDCLRSNEYIATTVDNLRFDAAKNDIFIEWSKRSPFNMPQCYDCAVIGICGGGCPINAKLRFGSIWALDTRFCVHAKLTLEWMIWDQYSHISENLL